MIPDPDTSPEVDAARELLRKLPAPAGSVAAEVSRRIAHRHVPVRVALFSAAVAVAAIAVVRGGDDLPAARGGRALSFVVLGDAALGARTPTSTWFSFQVERNPHPFFMLYAIDAAREVHWFYPAYVDPAQDPVALPMPALPQLLPDKVQLDHPATGPLHIIMLGCDRSPSVHEVEEHVKSGADAPPSCALSRFVTELHN